MKKLMTTLMLMMNACGGDYVDLEEHYAEPATTPARPTGTEWTGPETEAFFRASMEICDKFEWACGRYTLDDMIRLEEDNGGIVGSARGDYAIFYMDSIRKWDDADHYYLEWVFLHEIGHLLGSNEHIHDGEGGIMSPKQVWHARRHYNQQDIEHICSYTDEC